MARIPNVDAKEIDPSLAEVFDRQVERWGCRLAPYQVYARRPTVFRAVIGMWEGLHASGLLDGRLAALVNRRVAALNGCVF